MGNNTLLKMSVTLNLPKDVFNKEGLEVSAKFFLTDSKQSPTTHSPVDTKVTIDCESTKPTCILANKPQSFTNYQHFTDWLSKGEFTNKIMITYDFHINVQQIAPSLAQHLWFVQPDYHFLGTHMAENSSVKPEKFEPQISYVSKRGTTNSTTATLGGMLYLSGNPYPISDHDQVFPHTMIEEKTFKTDNTKRFYHPDWIADCETTSKVSYEESPKSLATDWPGIPSATYSVLQRKPDDKHKIEHLVCFDGETGDEINIKSSGKAFLIESEDSNAKNSDIKEVILKDDQGKLYISQYKEAVSATSTSSSTAQSSSLVPAQSASSSTAQTSSLVPAQSTSSSATQPPLSAFEQWRKELLSRSEPWAKSLWEQATSQDITDIVLSSSGFKVEVNTVEILEKGNFVSLTRLLLQYTNIGPAGTQILTRGNFIGLRTLHLAFSNIGDAGAQTLATGQFPSLMELGLQNTNINDVGAQSLAIGNLTALTTLYLDYNNIGDAGIQSLVNGNFRALMWLGLSNNKITPVGAQSLVTQTNLPSLEYIYLNHNDALFGSTVGTYITAHKALHEALQRKYPKYKT